MGVSFIKMDIEFFVLLLALHLCYGELIQSGVSWFGDARGGKPEDNFYDVTYDESVCPTSVSGNAVANYVFNGALLRTLWVSSSGECLTECYKEIRCKSVNFYPSRRNTVQNVCELSEQSQIFDPTLMIQYDGATYYENIECVGDKRQRQLTKSSSKNLPANEEHGPSFPEQKETLLRQKSLNAFKKQQVFPEVQPDRLH